MTPLVLKVLAFLLFLICVILFLVNLFATKVNAVDPNLIWAIGFGGLAAWVASTFWRRQTTVVR